MSKDQAIGALILVGSIVGIVVYAWLIYSYAIVVLQITAFLAVAAMLAILAWIGWTMATTPPPAPLEPEPATTSPTSDSANLRMSTASVVTQAYPQPMLGLVMLEAGAPFETESTGHAARVCLTSLNTLQE